jgi:hypothetical protein
MQSHFLKLKSNLELEPTFAGNVSSRHLAVREYLKNNHPEFKDAKLIGSLQRKTRIHPGAAHKIDIDIIVIMGEFHNWVSAGGITPQAALDSLHSTVDSSARYNSMEPVQDAPTVTLTDTDGLQVQLVPAYVDMVGRSPSGISLGQIGRGYWIAKEGQWQMADYDYEADWVSQQNIVSDGYLIPTIKMLKAIKRIYFPQLDSFPLEIIAAHIIPTFVLGKQLRGEAIYYQDLILNFFQLAPARLSAPIQVPGSKSAAIVLDQVAVASLKDIFAKIVNFIVATSRLPVQSDRVENWRKLCGDHFPATV